MSLQTINQLRQFTFAGNPTRQWHHYPDWFLKAVRKWMQEEGQPETRDEGSYLKFDSPWGKLFDHEYSVEVDGITVLVTAPYHDYHSMADTMAELLGIELLSEKGLKSDQHEWLFAFGPGKEGAQ